MIKRGKRENFKKDSSLKARITARKNDTSEMLGICSSCSVSMYMFVRVYERGSGRG